MRTFAFALAVFTAVALTASAQIGGLPPSSAADGIPVLAPNSLDAYWWQQGSLYSYRLDPANPLVAPVDAGLDSLGQHWAKQAPDLTPVVQQGGTLRIIFLGTDAPDWVQGVGYSYSGDVNGADSFTIAANGYSPNLAALSFGSHVDISLGAYEAPTFQYWVAGPDHSVPAFANGMSWTQDPLSVATFLPVLGGVVDVPTWVASVSDPTTDTQYRFAFQQFAASGSTFGAVPEPASYGYLAALVACGAMTSRRFRRRR